MWAEIGVVISHKVFNIRTKKGESYMVEVMKNGKIVKRFSTVLEAWDYIENQTDKETAKYTVLDYR